MFKFIVRGARGTMPACGKQFAHYGGNTTCFSVHMDEGMLVFDAGTGISHLANTLSQLSRLPPITMFFTHFHMDHVIGLPCFDPLYDSQASIKILGDPQRKGDWRELLNNFMEKPYWPVGLGEADASMELEDLPVKEGKIECYGSTVSWFAVPHPQECMSYRIDSPDKSYVIATDCEYGAMDIDPKFIEFCRNADYLLYDSQYSPDEYASHRGWGHSTWETAVEVAQQASVKQLVLTHHAPYRTDSEMESIVEAAKKQFPETKAARDNMILE